MPGDRRQRFGVTDPTRSAPEHHRRGQLYLRFLQDKFNGDPQQVQKILQSYNGGEGHVDRNDVSDDAKAYATTVLRK